MPISAPVSPLHHYTAIEAAYRQGEWDTVLQQGRTLGQSLAQERGTNAQALLQRLELMLGHTQLYGFGNIETAKAHYQALLNKPVEASLRQLAEEGLRQCNERVDLAATRSDQRETPATLDGNSDGTAGFGPTLQQLPLRRAAETNTPAAEPWLAKLVALRSRDSEVNAEPPQTSNGSAGLQAETTLIAADGEPGELETLIPDVIVEPELIELQQADPNLDDELTFRAPATVQGQGMAALAEAAAAEVAASGVGVAPDAAPAAASIDADLDLLSCLRLVRLS
ncbi:MAG: hypothetical protein ACKN89_16725 [Cyanobium sp.]